MNDFRNRIHDILKTFKRKHRGVKPRRFVMCEEDYLSFYGNGNVVTLEKELKIFGIMVVRGDYTHIESGDQILETVRICVAAEEAD
ncbi:MAG: hypothetical protein WCS52_04735 [bacterium]